MTDPELKLMDKKSLRLLVKDLTSQRDDLLNKLGVLTSERDNLIETNRLQREGLAKIASDKKHVEDEKEILEANVRRLGDQVQFLQANKTVSVILKSTLDDFKRLFKKRN